MKKKTQDFERCPINLLPKTFGVVLFVEFTLFLSTLF